MKNLAFIVTCDRYDDDYFPDLDEVNLDAQLMKDAFEQNCGCANDDIIVCSLKSKVYRPFSDSTVIKMIIEEGKSRSGQKYDRIFFFFSGHGFQQNGDTFIVVKESLLRFHTGLLKVATIIRALKDSNLSDYIVCFFDMCLDELSTKGVNPNNSELSHDGVVCFYSCAEGEKSFLIEKKRESCFTHCLSLALKKENGCRTVSEVDQFIKATMDKINVSDARQQFPHTELKDAGLSGLVITENGEPISTDGTEPEEMYKLGMIALEEGQREKASSYFKKALSANSNHVAAIINKLVEAYVASLNNEKTGSSPKTAEANLFGLKNDLEAGDTFTFGTYKQGGNNDAAEKIEWRVLDVDEEKGKALVISLYGLDAKEYNEEFEEVTWEKCTLHDWLNDKTDGFYGDAFTEEERSRILLTENENTDNPEYKTKGGKNSKDYIFLLSRDEAGKYFESNEERKCKATPHAKDNGADVDPNGYAWWWLRSPGGSNLGAARVNHDGSLLENGFSVNSVRVCVRPAFYLNLES